MAGIAGVCRNSHGEYALWLPETNYGSLTLNGGMHSYLAGDETGWERVVIQSHSKKAIDRLLMEDLTPDLTYSISSQCRALTLGTTTWKFEFVPRLANKVADRMAKDCRISIF